MDVQITYLPKYEDARGFLVEFLSGVEVTAAHEGFGQIYLTTIMPGQVRGNHYHRTLHEYFTVMAGRIQLLLEDVEKKERMELMLDAADRPLKRVRFGPHTAHALRNDSDTVAVVVSYATEVYNRDHVDQVPYTIQTP